jgi:hypothetical protein
MISADSSQTAEKQSTLKEEGEGGRKRGVGGGREEGGGRREKGGGRREGKEQRDGHQRPVQLFGSEKFDTLVADDQREAK